MADLVADKHTSLSPDDVVVRSVQFFTTGRWRAQSQSQRIATFVGRPPIPIGMLILTVIGFAFCIVPGIVFYVLAVRKAIQLQNIVVTANPASDGGSDVIVKHSKTAATLVRDFVNSLPA